VISPPPLPLGAVGASVATQSIGLLEAKRQRLLEFEEPLEQLARDVARNGADHPFSGRSRIQLAPATGRLARPGELRP
jgi:hypothetical protein